MNTLVERLKDNGQDYEFYPTTGEIIAAMVRNINAGKRAWDCRSFNSFLDIGAGNGKVLNAIKEQCKIDELYAIEKSLILQQQLNRHVFVVGADFMEQSLIGKNYDVTFCNPPYSEYEEWAEKIIMESSSKVVFLVIPERWAKSEKIKGAIAYRESKANVLGKFDFQDAEDRAARAVVNLIKIEMNDARDDAFDRFFDREFSGVTSRFDLHEKTETKHKYENVVKAGNYAESLVECYNAEMENIRKNYYAVASLDVDLLKEFEIDPRKIKELLKKRLHELKRDYWRELLSNMSAITDRLCSGPRECMVRKLDENGNVDFTLQNIYSIVIWAIKNANEYIESQLTDLFYELASKANTQNYKSNKRVFEGNNWQYKREHPSHIYLEYRLVLECTGGVNKGDSWNSGLSERAATLLKDVLTVARNLGFKCNTNPWQLSRDNMRKWKSGEVFILDQVDKSGATKPLIEARAFYNGNMHLRLSQDLALALNVECGRLNGWLASPGCAVDELGDDDAAAAFGKLERIELNSVPMLMPAQVETGKQTVEESPCFTVEAVETCQTEFAF